jgi:CcmD family protein
MIKHISAFALLLLSAMQTWAQEPEMADKLRADGKIYVVVVVLATIFAGIFGYLVYIDRKITKIERDND